jgi:hypothetical protein
LLHEGRALGEQNAADHQALEGPVVPSRFFRFRSLRGKIIDAEKVIATVRSMKTILQRRWSRSRKDQANSQ